MASDLSPLRIDLGDRSYPIVFSGSFDLLADAARPCVAGRACAVVTNEAVGGLYGDAVCAALEAAGGRAQRFLLPDGEERKNLRTLECLLEEFARAGMSRTAVVVALGGGVVGDVAGFAAAAYMRGVDCIQVPTTLLAQVDSSVGGKTGVNLAAGKNLAGAFHQPRLVFINWNTLATLPPREARAGYAEVIKYGVIADAPLFEQLERETPGIIAALCATPARIPAALGAIIRRCCAIKADVVGRDEREGGLRAILNYGHTFAHAVEALTAYGEYVHGEAVAIGMHAAARLAAGLGLCDAALVARQARLLEAAGLPTAFPALEFDAVLAAFGRDKKSRGATLRFVLPRRIGAVEIIENPDMTALRAAIAPGGGSMHQRARR